MTDNDLFLLLLFVEFSTLLTGLIEAIFDALAIADFVVFVLDFLVVLELTFLPVCLTVLAVRFVVVLFLFVAIMS
jgi:hypothetical protein